MGAAERHRGAEAERGKAREHTRYGRDRARSGGGLAGAGENQDADRDQKLPYPLRDLAGDRAVHQTGGKVAAGEPDARNQPPGNRRARRNEFVRVGPLQPAEI